MNEYITLEQAAALEEITHEGIRIRISRNPERYDTITQASATGGKDRVLVRVSSLSVKAQSTYMKTLDIGKEPQSNTADETPWYTDIDINGYIESNGKAYYSAVEMSKEIRAYLDYDGKSKVKYAQEIADRHGMSLKSFYRMRDRYLEGCAWAAQHHKEDGRNYDYYKILALCRKASKCNKFPSMSVEIKLFCENMWFNRDFAVNQCTVELLYERLIKYCRENGYTYPSYKTIARYINYINEGNGNARYLTANGLKEYKNKCLLKGQRDHTSVSVMEVLVGDAHTFDVWVKYIEPNGRKRAIRPTLVLWQDMRSRIVCGAVVCEHCNSDVIKQSLAKVIHNEGVPRYLLIDNGKDYTAETMTGVNRKIRMCFDAETKGYYQSIGIEDYHRAKPYEPWVKDIERTFGTICSRFSKQYRSYVGTLTGSRTSAKIQKDIDGMLERDELPTMEQFLADFELWTAEVYHRKAHGGLKKQKEKWHTPIEVFENCEDKYFKAPPPKEYTASLLMKAERCTVYNIGIKRKGYCYNSVELASYIGEKVDIKYDPTDITRIFVYNAKTGRKLCEAVSQELLMIAPKVPQKALEEHIKMQKQQIKIDRAKAKYFQTPLEERVEAYDPSRLTAGALDFDDVENPPIVAMPVDRQYAEEIREKRDRKTDNTFLQEQAKAAMEKLRQLS